MAPLGPPPPLCPWEYQPPQNLWAPPLHLPGFPGSIPQHPKASGTFLSPPQPLRAPGTPRTFPGTLPHLSASPKAPNHPLILPLGPPTLLPPHTQAWVGSTQHTCSVPPYPWTGRNPPPLFGPPFLTPSSHRRPVPQLLEAVTTTCCALPHDEQSPCAEEQVGIGGGTLGVGTEGCVGVSGTGEHVVDAPDPPTLHLPFPAALSANRCSLRCPTQLLARPPRLLCVGGPRAAALL